MSFVLTAGNAGTDFDSDFEAGMSGEATAGEVGVMSCKYFEYCFQSTIAC